jgi:hypothetical protein
LFVALPPRQHAHDLERKKRGLAHQKQKLLFRDCDQLDIGFCNRRGAARRVVYQRHLAKYAVGRKLGERAIAQLNGYLSALDCE